MILPEGWRDCRVPVWLVIPRHSDSVTQKEGFPVNPGLGAKADHPLSSNSPGRKATFSASQSLKQLPWPLGLRASVSYSQNAPGGNSGPELWMWPRVFSWLSHSRPAPSPLLIRTGSSESGWLASCRGGWEAELPPVICGGHWVGVLLSVFLSPEAVVWINSSFLSQTKTWKILLWSRSLLSRSCFLCPFLAFSLISVLLGGCIVMTNRSGENRPAVMLFHFANGLSYRNLFYVWKESVFS